MLGRRDAGVSAGACPIPDIGVSVGFDLPDGFKKLELEFELEFELLEWYAGGVSAMNGCMTSEAINEGEGDGMASDPNPLSRSSLFGLADRARARRRRQRIYPSTQMILASTQRPMASPAIVPVAIPSSPFACEDEPLLLGALGLELKLGGGSLLHDETIA
jgi:hypothetical protein